MSFEQYYLIMALITACLHNTYILQSMWQERLLSMQTLRSERRVLLILVSVCVRSPADRRL